MKYKDLKGYLIAIDLDGTLVQNFDDIDKETFETLKQVAKQNYVVIATGRPFRSSKYFYDLLELNTPIINYNGALLHNPKDSNFPKKMITIDKSKLLKFIDCNKDILDNLFCEIEDDIYLYKDEKGIEPYLHLNGGDLHTGDFETILPSDPNGAILFVKLNCEKQLEDYVKIQYDNEVKLRYWFTNQSIVCEFYNPLTSKANALKIICDYYNIPHHKTIAIGDGHNDIELLEFANISVAMGNSHKELIPHANIITDDVKNNGVLKFLNMDIKNE